MRRAPLVVSLVVLVGACCGSRSDADFVGAVRKDLAKGPAALCCAGQPNDAACVADAPKRCAYVVGGTVTRSEVTRLPHGGGAQVMTEIAGPHGRGTCHHDVSEGLELTKGVCSPPHGP